MKMTWKTMVGVDTNFIILIMTRIEMDHLKCFKEDAKIYQLKAETMFYIYLMIIIILKSYCDWLQILEMRII